jgi:SRSO17 transposase
MPWWWPVKNTWRCREPAGEWKRLARSLAREDWQILSAGTGSKGARLFAWARIELAAPEVNGWQRWLLVRQNLDEGAKPAERAYVLIFAPVGTTLQEMVEADRARWTVEQCFEEGKGEVGLDEYEVRSWHGWFRHIRDSRIINYPDFLAGCILNVYEPPFQRG